MKKLFAVALFLCYSLLAVAQTRVEGNVLDAESKSPVQFATVAVYNIKDTSLVDGAITGSKGNFTVSKVPKGDYMLRISFVGFMTLYKNITITDDKKPYDLGNLELTKGVELQEFVVRDLVIPIQIKNDTVEYNAEAFKPIEGAMLEELLKKLPGAEVDENGKITINGKVITQILVEGEKFFTDDPQMAAKNIPADFVQKVQTFEKKSDDAIFTGIDDGKEEQVINLKLKPEVIKGNWFGRLTAAGGIDANNKLFRYNNHVTLNHFKGSDRLTIIGNFNNISRDGMQTNFTEDGSVEWENDGYTHVGISKLISPAINFVKKINPKWSINGNYSYKNNDREYEEDVFEEKFTSFGSQFNHRTDSSQYIGNVHSFNAELKYAPGANDEITIRPVFSLNNRSYQSAWDYELRDTSAMINQGTTRSSNRSSNPNMSLGLSYGHRFAKPRRTIRFNASGSYNTRESTGYDYTQRHFAIQPSDTVDQYNDDNRNGNSWNASATYTEPLIRDFILSFSYGVSGNASNGERLTYNYDALTESYHEVDTFYSRTYGNTGFSQRFGAQIQKSIDKYNYSFGLDLMPSKSLNFTERMDDVSQNVFELSPHARFNYTFSEQSSLKIDYRGATRQPSRYQLQSIPDKSNPTYIHIGNPDLKPEFEHQIDATYNVMFANNASIYANMYSRMTQNGMRTTQIYTPELFPHIAFDSSAFAPGVSITMYENMNFVYNTYSYVSFSTPLFSKQLSLNISVNGNLSHDKNKVDENINVLKNLGLGGSLGITYRPNERFNIHLTGGFRQQNSRFSLQSDRNNRYYNGNYGMNFSWQIIKDKLILSSDINYRETSGYADGYNLQNTRWNAQIQQNFGKTNNWQLRFSVEDILNDKKDYYRYAYENYIVDYVYKNTLRRYFMLSLTYNFRRMHTPPKEEGVE